MTLPDEMTFGESLGPAMEITDQAEADAYFEALVERHLRITDDSQGRAVEVQKVNLGYYAGYYDSATMARVNRLYKCAHPVFGTTTPTAEEAFAAGASMSQLKEEA